MRNEIYNEYFTLLYYNIGNTKKRNSTLYIYIYIYILFVSYMFWHYRHLHGAHNKTSLKHIPINNLT